MDNSVICGGLGLRFNLSSYNDVHLTLLFDIIVLLKTRLVIIFIAISLAVFYFLSDPSESRLMPQCVFHRVTGLQCVGCGAQRMAHSLLHGEFVQAFRSNALLFVSLPFIIFLIWVEISRKKRPGLYSKVYSNTLIVATGAVMLLWFVFRNLIGI